MNNDIFADTGTLWDEMLQDTNESLLVDSNDLGDNSENSFEMGFTSYNESD